MNSLHFVAFAICVTLCMGGQCSGPEDKRVYTFGVGTQYMPFSFLNEDGELMGFFLDIVRRVCEIACKKCEFVGFNDFSICWNADTMQSIGLNNRYFDVCTGWVGTKQRELVYSIFGTFSNAGPDALFVRQDSDIRTFDPDNHKIGFFQSYRADKMCLKQQKRWEVKHVSQYPYLRALYDSVTNNTVDVAFMNERAAIFLGGLRKISDTISCVTKGNSLMMRKDMAPDYAWFTPALKKVMASSYYKWICNIAKRGYGSDPNCIIKP